MLEGMNRILERIDELNNSFRGMGPRHARREKQTFASVMNDVQKSPPETPQKFAALSPLGKIAPAVNPFKTAVSESPPVIVDDEDPEYSELIGSYAQKHGLDPSLVRRVIEAESNFDPKSVSKKGAMGLMQLMPETARELGVTNPFDPEQNIAGGTKYLARLLKQNRGNISLALAAYNAGPGAVRDHGGIPPFPETKQYIAKILRGIQKDLSQDSLENSEAIEE